MTVTPGDNHKIGVGCLWHLIDSLPDVFDDDVICLRQSGFVGEFGPVVYNRDLKVEKVPDVCNSLTHRDPCFHCTKELDGEEALCVVEEPFNIASIERTGAFKGRYHVLLGALSPLKGIGPDELKTDRLVARVRESGFKEIIIATNPTVEGEATALFLAGVLKESGVKVTRLAMGLPVGSDLDFADQVTIKKSLEGRTELTED